MAEIEVPEALRPALEEMIRTFAKKGADYSVTTDWSSNFRSTAQHFGIEPHEACDFNEVQKLARLRALRERGKAPDNENVHDTYLDKANYALYAFALYLLHERSQQRPPSSPITASSSDGRNTTGLSSQRDRGRAL